MLKGYFLGLGSNISPSVYVPRALLLLQERFGTLEVSRIVETAPTAGLSGGFLNAVIYLQTDLEAIELKAALCRIETELGRDRNDPGRALKDRTVDLDILLELVPGQREVPVECISQESYYRPSMVELVKAMGIACAVQAQPVWSASQVLVRDVPIGLQPIRVLKENGSSGAVRERRAALVTGAAVRLGYEIATALARSGYDIALHYNSSHAAAQVAAEKIKALGVRCELFKQDLAEVPSMPALMREVVNRFPHLNVLVNSASVYEQAKIAETTTEMFDLQWAVNFRAPFFLMKEFSRAIEHGSIVNLIDNKIAFNQYHYAAYLGSKKALADLTKMAALEFAPRIRVNGVAPGVVLPQADRGQTYLDWRKQTIPTLKLGCPSQICTTVEALLQNDFITGQIVFVDGGESMNLVGRNLGSFAEDNARQTLEAVSVELEAPEAHAA